VLAGRVRVGARVAIIGGGAVGVETALFLAQKGTLSADAVKFLFVNRAEPVEDLYRLSTIGTKQIVIVEMLDHVGPDIGKSTRWGMMQDMHRHRVRIKTNTKAKEITPAGVIAETVDGIQEIPADTVVLALGSKSYNPLAEICKRWAFLQGLSETPGKSPKLLTQSTKDTISFVKYRRWAWGLWQFLILKGETIIH